MVKVKVLSISFLIFLGCSFSIYAQISISDQEGYEIHPSAVLDLSSTDKGFLLPRMTTSERDEIDNPAQSLLIYNTVKRCIETYFAGGWHEFWCYEDDLCAGPGPEPCDDEASVTFTYNGDEITYGTVKGQNGTCWLDRNLGADKVAGMYDDSDAYGHLFQWGRGDDGHQERNSPTSEANACVDTDTPGHNTFLRAATACNFDWRTGHNDDLWQGDGGINDPCPSGWRLPTESELEAEMTAFTSNDYLGAYCSTLRFTRNGLRTGTNIGSMGCYWTSDPHSSINYGAMGMFFEFGDWDIEGLDRFYGCAVRCIKD